MSLVYLQRGFFLGREVLVFSIALTHEASHGVAGFDLSKVTPQYEEGNKCSFFFFNLNLARISSAQRAACSSVGKVFAILILCPITRWSLGIVRRHVHWFREEYFGTKPTPKYRDFLPMVTNIAFRIRVPDLK